MSYNCISERFYSILSINIIILSDNQSVLNSPVTNNRLKFGNMEQWTVLYFNIFGCMHIMRLQLSIVFTYSYMVNVIISNYENIAIEILCINKLLNIKLSKFFKFRKWIYFSMLSIFHLFK